MADFGDVLVLAAFRLELAEPGVELEVEDGRRAERGLAALEVGEIVIEIPVVAFVVPGIAVQFLAEEEDGQARRDVEALLGAGDADVDIVPVHAERFGQEGADDIHDQGHVVFVAQGADFVQVVQLPRRSLVVLAEEDVRPLGGDGLLEGIIVDIRGEGNDEIHDGHLVILAELEPAMSERSSVDDDGFLLGRHIVFDDGTHGAGPGTGIDDGPSAGTMDQVEQDLLGLFVDLGERIRSHI